MYRLADDSRQGVHLRDVDLGPENIIPILWCCPPWRLDRSYTLAPAPFEPGVPMTIS